MDTCTAYVKSIVAVNVCCAVFSLAFCTVHIIYDNHMFVCVRVLQGRLTHNITCAYVCMYVTVVFEWGPSPVLSSMIQLIIVVMRCGQIVSSELLEAQSFQCTLYVFEVGGALDKFTCMCIPC